jgi:ATP/maltotriose-dependent transcriptional regulator MalT/DNA-binding SARP family transcriptional activator
MSASPSATDARSAQQGKSIPRDRLVGRLGDALEGGDLILTAGGGCGKTTVLEQAVRATGRPVAWVGCSEVDRAPGALLMRIVGALADAAPGASDALAERLGVGIERVNVTAATRELLDELSRLLVEPIVLVIDDAEHLDSAPESQKLVSALFRAELPPLHLALASRRPLDLRVAKPRAEGRLTELTAADLAFDAEACAALLRRFGSEPSDAQIDAVLEATEGWPLGVALTAGMVGRQGADAGGSEMFAQLSSAPDLRAYLSEELLDALEPDLRAAAISSCVTRVVTPSVASALDLPDDFVDRLERAGVLLRRLDDGRSFAYHPLLREFLFERLGMLSDEERSRLHAAVAPAVAAGGDAIGSIGHWLEAERWPEAVAAIEHEGPALLRTSPELLMRWFESVPADVRALPAMRTLEGQLEWGVGRHERAVTPLREAVDGHRRAGDAEREWLARFFLAEALFSAGPFDEMLELADGWEEVTAPRAKVGAAGVAWYKVLGLTALGRRDEADQLAEQLRRDTATAAQFKYLGDLAYLLGILAAGGAENALMELRSTIRELELDDPQGRLAVSLSVTGLVNLDVGQLDAAMDWFKRSQLEADRRGLGFVARDAHLQRASLLAHRGELAEAELELEQAGARQGTGWRGVSRPTAEAFVASARGDATEATAAAERALERVRPGLVCFRVWAALAMAPVLAETGSPDRAVSAIEEATKALDAHFPGKLGRYHRARLLATGAWLEYEAGERDAAYKSLRRAWDEAGDRASDLARAHWAQLKPVLYGALENETIDPAYVLPALAAVLPGAEALIAFTEHPKPEVRRGALAAALAADHPVALAELPKLLEDSDERVAGAALAAQERLRRSAPSLRFGLLGRFRVKRSGREIDESEWSRPIDARLVRFLLVHADEQVPEDLIFEALWPDLSASSARRSLQVAVSRVRKVLDVPGAPGSAIESGDRCYLMQLAERDAIDAEEFRIIATRALDDRGSERRRLLERACELWGGEPLPEERYSDWALPYRERLSDTQIAVLTALIEHHELAGDHARASEAARQLVDLDLLNEEGHRALMRAYARTGRRGHALRQYLECRRAMVDSLGVEPAEATSLLQARILAGEAV